MGSHQSLTFKLAGALLLLLAAAAPITTITEARVLSQVAAEQTNNQTGPCESPKPSENATAVQQAVAAIAVASAKAKEAEGLAWKLKAEPGTEGALADCLGSCAEMYSTAYDSLQAADKILKGAGEPGRDLMVELTSAVGCVMTCSDGFDERPELASPVAGINGELGSLIGQCLALGASLKH